MTAYQARPQAVGIGGGLAGLLVTIATVLVLLTIWPPSGLWGYAFLAAWMSGSWAALSRSASRAQEIGGIGTLLILAVVGVVGGESWGAEAAWLSGLTALALGFKVWVRRAKPEPSN